VEVFALQSIAFGTGFRKCVYDDDCSIGTACIFVPKPHRAGEMYRQSICVDCAHLAHNTTQDLDSSIYPAVQAMLGVDAHWGGHAFTKARSGDRWPVAPDAATYCSNYLETKFVEAWSTQAQKYAASGHNVTDFSHCLHVQEAMSRYGLLDVVVTVIAFFLVCLSISADRQQQLFNAYLRSMLMPPAWRSSRSAAHKLVELLLSSLHPQVCFTMTMLLFGSETLQATEVLLNGVAISFVLMIDDELPKAFVSDTDLNAINTFASEAGDAQVLLIIKRKALANAGVSFIGLIGMFVICEREACDNMVLASFFLCVLMPLATRFAEEMVALPTTMRLLKADMAFLQDRAVSRMRRASRVSLRRTWPSSKSTSPTKGWVPSEGSSPSQRTSTAAEGVSREVSRAADSCLLPARWLLWRHGKPGPLLDALIEALLASSSVVLLSRVTIQLYLLEGVPHW